ncbi:MAG: DUF4398 domain-containing protein [Myxococcales bacterium]|nr:DUF4398 domain-containing protein [Myxococcales bacterium]
MKKSIASLIIAAPFLWACATVVPPPTQRMADAQSAERSARELGADHSPEAQLSLKLAQDQIALARTAMTDGDNERATSLLMRANADAELSIAQARESAAKVEEQKANDAAAKQKTANIAQGAER